jgi:hypothetical protein
LELEEKAVPFTGERVRWNHDQMRAGHAITVDAWRQRCCDAREQGKSCKRAGAEGVDKQQLFSLNGSLVTTPPRPCAQSARVIRRYKSLGTHRQT